MPPTKQEASASKDPANTAQPPVDAKQPSKAKVATPAKKPGKSYISTGVAAFSADDEITPVAEDPTPTHKPKKASSSKHSANISKPPADDENTPLAKTDKAEEKTAQGKIAEKIAEKTAGKNTAKDVVAEDSMAAKEPKKDDVPTKKSEAESTTPKGTPAGDHDWW